MAVDMPQARVFLCPHLLSLLGLTHRYPGGWPLPSGAEVVGPRTTRWCLAQGIPGDVWKDLVRVGVQMEGRDPWRQGASDPMDIQRLQGRPWPPFEGAPSTPCPAVVHTELGWAAGRWVCGHRRAPCGRRRAGVPWAGRGCTHDPPGFPGGPELACPG